MAKFKDWNCQIAPRAKRQMHAMDFIIDDVGDQELLHKTESSPQNGFANVEDDALENFISELKEAVDKIERNNAVSAQRQSERKADELIEQFYERMGWGTKFGEQTFKDKISRGKNRFRFENLNLETGKLLAEAARIDVDKHMSKSALGPGFEKQVALPEYDMSDKRLKAIRKREREKTKGPSWYNLPAPEITETVKNDLEILKMRSVLNPKRFYKKNDMEALPKYFQIGKVMDSALDHQNTRLTKKERKQTFVDELLADAEFNRYNKKKFKQIIEEKRKTTYKTYIKDKRKKSKMAFNKKKKANKSKKKESA